MSVTIKGSSFYFNTGLQEKSVSILKFFDWLKNIDNIDRDWPYYKLEKNPPFTRRLYLNDNDKHIAGLIISSKTNIFHHFVKKDENGKVTIEAKPVDGNPPVEINFFCVRKDSMKGIYSHYMSSYAFNLFLSELWSTYLEFVKQKKAEADQSSTTEDVNKRFTIRGIKNYGPLFTPGEFEDLIGKLQTISEVRATTYELEGADKENSSLSNNLKSVHQVFRLEGQSDNAIFNWIKSLRNKTARGLKSGKTVYSGSVVGTTNDDQEITINFTDTMDDYLGFDYDDLGTFDTENLLSHNLVKEMIKQMDEKIVFKPAN
ncbi:hypothetical protein [Seleniivibrio woodruffii]|jgi:hypothetical protein|uniref:Uncharacterized protein n=1 Tax=Seleniivibrio woodruffii TaxID=1078050 RepID=A0A4R1K3G3_9BACT|nr:hypothetical protein [Seleniivibrio woodruffii]TCK58427.1 hypothetical protein C8D98_2629 [Seleniivibrio woodruffii]TVZ36800.1 hypothetical protein OF66_2438 [Seleniivibrio woodruffii]